MENEGGEDAGDEVIHERRINLILIMISTQSFSTTRATPDHRHFEHLTNTSCLAVASRDATPFLWPNQFTVQAQLENSSTA